MIKPPSLPSSQADLERSETDSELEKVLQEMLEADENITARGATRRHSSLKAASSITRSSARATLLASYKEKQEQYRKWRRRDPKSNGKSALTLAEKELRISELESQVSLLTYSHVAMIRTVGELGGMAKWARFFEDYQDVRNRLWQLGAMPIIKDT